MCIWQLSIFSSLFFLSIFLSVTLVPSAVDNKCTKQTCFSPSDNHQRDTWNLSFKSQCDQPRSFSLISKTFCSRSRSLQHAMIKYEQISFVFFALLLSLSLSRPTTTNNEHKARVLSIPIRFFVSLASSISVHITKVQSYSGDEKNAFTFRMKGRSYTIRVWNKQNSFGGSWERSEYEDVH